MPPAIPHKSGKMSFSFSSDSSGLLTAKKTAIISPDTIDYNGKTAPAMKATVKANLARHLSHGLNTEYIFDIETKAISGFFFSSFFFSSFFSSSLSNYPSPSSPADATLFLSIFFILKIKLYLISFEILIFKNVNSKFILFEEVIIMRN